MISKYSLSGNKASEFTLARKENMIKQNMSELKQKVKFLESSVKARNHTCSYQSSPVRVMYNDKKSKALFNDENQDPIIQRIIEKNNTFVKEKEDEIKNAKLLADQLIQQIEQIKLNEKLKLETKIHELE